MHVGLAVFVPENDFQAFNQMNGHISPEDRVDVSYLFTPQLHSAFVCVKLLLLSINGVRGKL